MRISFFLFLGHVYLSIVHPKTRHAFVGITRGRADEDWALQHHRKWTEPQRAAAGRADEPEI
jgi:formate dehydrogenase subunit gamma